MVERAFRDLDWIYFDYFVKDLKEGLSLVQWGQGFVIMRRVGRRMSTNGRGVGLFHRQWVDLQIYAIDAGNFILVLCSMLLMILIVQIFLGGDIMSFGDFGLMGFDVSCWLLRV